MPQISIYGLNTHLNPIKTQLSDVLHSCMVDAFAYPLDKRFHRFFPLDRENFIVPADRSDAYTIVEVSMFSGRSMEAKKMLIRLMFERVAPLGISGQDLEITLFENPPHNWGFRGLPGDEHTLNYAVKA